MQSITTTTTTRTKCKSVLVFHPIMGAKILITNPRRQSCNTIHTPYQEDLVPRVRDSHSFEVAEFNNET